MIKQERRFIITLRNLNLFRIMSFLKSSLTLFGNFALSTIVNITGFFHFGVGLMVRNISCGNTWNLKKTQKKRKKLEKNILITRKK